MANQSYKKIINKFKQKHLLVVGDVVLDQYIKGSCTRISPEAPVPVVLQDESFYTPGGAANVGHNLTNLGAAVTLVGRIGQDIEADILKKELKKCGISLKGLFVDERVDTIFKTRIIAQHQQVVRLDREKRIDFDDSDFKFKKVCPFIKKNFKQYDGVIISDYGKGMIDTDLVDFICSLAKKEGVPIVVDPKVHQFKVYGAVTSITPNKKEAENALKTIPHEARREMGILSETLDSARAVEQAGKAFLNNLDIESLLVTLGESGMYLFERGKKSVRIKTKAKEVYDVSGAGDTVISVFSLALACGASKPEAADLANYAAGVVVGREGAVAISKQELLAAINQ